MATTQQPQYLKPASWCSIIWRVLTSPGLVLWLLVLTALGCLMMGLLPQIPLETLRDPATVDLWLRGVKAPWANIITSLNSIGLTHLVHSRLFYIYCALVAVTALLHLLRLLTPHWAQPLGTLTSEQWHLPCSQQDTLAHLERGTVLIGLRLLHRPLPHAHAGTTMYAQGVSRGIRRWGSTMLALGLFIILATGLSTSWNDAPSEAVAISPGEVFPLPGEPGTLLQLSKLNVSDHQGNQEIMVVSDWMVTRYNHTSQLRLLPGRPVYIGEIGLYLLGYGPAVHLTATGADGRLLRLQRVLGDNTLQDTLRLRFDRDQQEQLVAQQDKGILLRLIHYPSLPAQGINGRALHIQVLRSDTGELLQQAYLDDSGSLSAPGITLDVSLDYYVMVRAQIEPWLWLVLLGGCLVIVGLICSLFMPHRELWLALTPSPTGTWCQVWVAPADNQTSWMQTWRAMIREVADVQR